MSAILLTLATSGAPGGPKLEIALGDPICTTTEVLSLHNQLRSAQPLSRSYCRIHAGIGATISRAIGGNYDLADPMSVPNQLHPDNLPRRLEFGQLELPVDAPRTDVLSVDFLPPMGLLVSTKMKAVLDTFELGPHAAYPVTVLHDGDALTYHWIQMIPEETPVDFAQSVFFAGDVDENRFDEIRFDSRTTLYAHEEANDLTILAKAVVLAETPALTGLPADAEIFASKALAVAVREAGLSGVELSPTRKIYAGREWLDATASLD